MSEYSSPITYGLAHPWGFFTKYPPITGRISTNPYDWSYGGVNMYPRPFNSWYQQINSGNNYLGPFARRVDTGKSGRIKMSMGGDIGFVEQCWYDFPRGAFDTDSNGDKYPENREFWAQAEKTRVSVYNLMTTGPNYVTVDVAISNTAATDPNTWWFFSPLSGKIANSVEAGINILTGSVHGMPGDTSTCGVGDTSGQLSGTLPDLSYSDGKGFGGLGWLWAGGGLADSLLGGLFNALTPAAQAGISTLGFDDANRESTLAGWLTDHLNKLGDFLDDLRDKSNAIVAVTDQATRDEFRSEVKRIMDAITTAADLMINGWFIPNILQSAPASQYGDNTTGTTANPYQWRPRDAFQQRLAESMNVDAGTGLPDLDWNNDGVIDSRDYVRQTTPNMPGTTGLFNTDWEHFLTLLNRGDNTTMPYIDQDRNEWVFHENYGFNRGGSISNSDDFLDWVTNVTNQQTSDSVAALLDMSPAAPVFIVTVVPIFVLEVAGRLIKTNKGEAIGATNLDAYADTKIEVRISAKNMKEGNPVMYNYLVNNGDHLGTTLTPVP